MACTYRTPASRSVSVSRSRSRSSRHHGVASLIGYEREVAIYLNLRRRGDDCQFQLVFFCIPSESIASKIPDLSDPHFMSCLGREIGDRVSNDKWDECEVFLGISNLVDSPKGVITSFVSFKLKSAQISGGKFLHLPAKSFRKCGSVGPKGNLMAFKEALLEAMADPYAV